MLAIIMVAATGGYGIVRHYCACDHTIAVVADHHTGAETACCTTEAEPKTESCCSASDHPINSHETPCNSGDACCTSVYAYFKTDQVSLIHAPALDFKFTPAYYTLCATVIDEQLSAFHPGVQYSDRLPPPKFGQELLVEIHQLKCDPLPA